MLDSKVEPIDAAFFERRLAAAIEYRQSVVAGSDAYRVVHAEADLLPALIVDRYGDYLSVQTLDQGMDAAKDWIVASLVKLLAPAGIVLRNDAAVRRKEELPLAVSVAHGEVPPVVPVRTTALPSHPDLLAAHKTRSLPHQ